MAAHDALPQDTFGPVEIRASHLTQGRIPSAIYKKTSELLESDKTKYWERICFCVQITSRQTYILGEPATLTFGGCRSLQDINFHGRKTSEVFQAYISYRAKICSNLMISLQDGMKNRIEATGPAEIYAAAYQLFSQFNAVENLKSLDGLGLLSPFLIRGGAKDKTLFYGPGTAIKDTKKTPRRILEVWSGKRDSNYFSEAFNNQHVAKRRKDIGCKMGETFEAFQGIWGKRHEAPLP